MAVTMHATTLPIQPCSKKSLFLDESVVKYPYVTRVVNAATMDDVVARWADNPSALINTTKHHTVRKCMINGQIVIEHNKERYNVLGIAL